MPAKAEDLFAEEPPTFINPYEVLGLEKSASADEVKSAYRKAALRSHPDKAPENEKDGAHTKFQEIAFAYAVLSDPKRRSRYDRTGRTDEAIVSLDDDGDFDWSDFYRAQFEDVISESAIDAFRAEYQGSAEEREHLLAAYEATAGDMERVYEEVMLSDPLVDEERFRGIIDGAIDTGEIEAHAAYTGESKAKRKRRMEKARGEAEEARELARELGVEEKLFGKSGGENGAKGKGKGKKGGKKEGGEDALAALIQQRQKDRARNFLDDLEEKYAPKPGKKRKGGLAEEPPEGAFQKNAAKGKRSKK